jgi:ankyrin repeat protein
MSFTLPDPPPQFEGHLADYLESDRPHLGRFGPPLSPIQKLARSDCSLKAIQDALERGVFLDCHWQKLDMIDPEPTGGCVLPRHISSHEQCWANYNTPFHKSVVNHHFDGATFLLAHGISVDVRNALRQTALHEAVERRDYEAVRYLLKCLADVDAFTEAVSLRATIHSEERVQQAGVVPLLQAINMRDPQMVDILVKGNANVNANSPEGWSLLDLAVIANQPKIIYTLLSRGAQLSKGSLSDVEIGKDEDIKAQAQLLRQSLSPPWNCHKVYQRVLNMAGGQKLLDPHVASKPFHIDMIASQFYITLAELANRPTVELTRAQQYCTKCIGYQAQLIPQDAITYTVECSWDLHHFTSIYGHYSSRDELRLSAQAGCIMCALFEDALVNKSGKWTSHKVRDCCGDLVSAPHVTLTTHFSYFARGIPISIRCGDESSIVEIICLSGELLPLASEEDL